MQSKELKIIKLTISDFKMDFTQVNRSELVGCAKSKTVIMESLIQSNALNRTGATNYNAFGVKDGIGFE